MKVLVNSTPVLLWRDMIHEAEAACATRLQEEIEAYLVFLLVRYMNKPEMVNQIMASNLLEGLNLGPKTRDFALQGVGDMCLLFSGLFPGVAERRLVKISYFINLGRGAYIAVSKTSDDLYDLLAQHFVSIMDILQSIRQHASEYPNLLPLEAYELWNESGSKRALRILKQYTEATPINIPLIEKDTCLIKIKK